ncbi:MAG: phosphatidate cytidylyltransferase [Hyphomicrobiaceae bacterium]
MSEDPRPAPVPTPSAASSARPVSNLGVRLVSALVLALATLAALYGGHPFWPLLVLVMTMALAWEWNRMLQETGTPAAVVLLLMLALVVGLATVGQMVWAIVLAVAAAAGLAAAGGAVHRLTHSLGLLYFGLPSVAMIWLAADAADGAQAVLFIMIVVWATDSAAYFTGRTLGGPKLWPSVSPNKTWSGSLGGLAGALLAGLVVAWLAGAPSLAWITVLSLLLSMGCQAGDLLESALKRRFDRKDTSGLIPGHGGVMDRLDGLLVAVVLAALIGLWRNPENPGIALLAGGGA